MVKRFALIGIAGFVAPRHLKAIRDTGNLLIAGLDRSDSVGIVDSYFPDAAFFTEFERFDRHLDKCARKGAPIEYLSVCSPNYLHDAHIRFGLRMGVDVICEKPLVLNPWNLDALGHMEKETGRRIHSILQLRVHPDILALKQRLNEAGGDRKHEVLLTYIAPRGKWYYASWKGNEEKSGGIATNIGIHFFDMLIWLFGDVLKMEVHQRSHDRAAGHIELETAKVKWFLSINADHLPDRSQRKTYRSITIDGTELEFSQGFEDLHTISYQEILSGRGFGIEEVRPSIQLVHDIRHAPIIGHEENMHHLAKLPTSNHPFHRDQNASSA